MVEQQPDAPYSVLPYSHENLARVLANHRGANAGVIKKSHQNYLQGYCDQLSVKTILVENQYIDRDYLEDYAGYYARCFGNYERFCQRVHFFSVPFSVGDFTEFLAGRNADLAGSVLNDTYLGFVVLKPLPSTFVGRTCLRTYPEENRRNYPITRLYEVSLYGTRLTIESLAFQEQDTTVAACATSALWSAFQFTGKQFQHHIPSPLEITRAAADKAPIVSRAVPNRGLEASMMAQAIRHVGLEPYVPLAHDDFESKEGMQLGFFLSTVYAYIAGRIPLILGVELIEDTGADGWKSHGLHAITLTGFSLQGVLGPNRSAKVAFRSRAGLIDRLYAHDDQVGPFSRLTVRDGTIVTAWVNTAGEVGKFIALPKLLLAPLYHKIRIPFDLIEEKVVHFDTDIRAVLQNVGVPALELTWDIRLTTASDYRQEIIEGPATLEARERVLVKPLPRFLWIARAELHGARVFDLIFDATDLEQGRLLMLIVAYDDEIFAMVKVLTSYIPNPVSRRSATIVLGFAEYLT